MGGAAMATAAMSSTHVAMMVRDMVEQHLLCWPCATATTWLGRFSNNPFT
jgi:hypothetical protein